MNNNIKYSSRVQPSPHEAEVDACQQVSTETDEANPWHSVMHLSSRTRYAIMRENLIDGITFLNEQDRQLAFAGQLLDELRFLPPRQVGGTALRARILLRGLADIPTARYKKVALFGNGAESPLKIHVVDNGDRKVLEFEQANLRQPGFQSILQSSPYRHQRNFVFSPELAAKTIGEILNLRFRNQSQSHLLEEQLKRVDDKIAQSAQSRRRLFAGQSSLATNEHKGIPNRFTLSMTKIRDALFRRIQAFRSHEPVWEEISTAPSTSNL